jgi:DNA-binding PadR family transcriptional regulator
MKQSKVNSFILFSLGAWFEEANKHIEDKPLQVSISKKTFIELVMNAGIARKQERALYKNLETLEKKKLISYENKDLQLTKKGEKAYLKVKDELKPYINVLGKLTEKSPTSYTRKVQTVFR